MPANRELLFNPPPQINFWVTMWQVEGPSLFGWESPVAAGIASAAVDLASTFAFGGFSSIKGIESGLELEAYPEGGNNDAKLQFTKPGTYATLILEHGVSVDSSLADWYLQVRTGEAQQLRKDGLIMLLDRGGFAPEANVGIPLVDRTPVAMWYFRKAVPTKVACTELNAMGQGLAIEQLSLVHEGMDRVSLGLLGGPAADALVMGGGILGKVFSGGYGAAVNRGAALGRL